MVLNIQKNPVLKAPPKKTITVASFDKGQITEYENDKIPFSAFSYIQNMVLRKKNLETRRGVTTVMEDTDIASICKINRDGDPVLGIFNVGATTTELSSINTTTWTKTSLVAAATGIQQPSWCNSNNKFYFTVGNDEIHSYDLDTSTHAIPLSLTGVKGVTFSDKRVWAITNNAMHYSTVSVDSFSDSLGTYDATSGQWSQGVTHGGQVSLGAMSNLQAVVSSGKTVVVFSKDSLQAHSLRDPAGLTYIDKDAVTVKYERSYGIDSARGVLVRGGYAYFVNQNGAYRLTISSGDIKELTQNKTQHQSFRFDQACIGYDKELSAVLISCQNNAANDVIIAYFEQYDAFSFYTNISANELVNIEDKLYGYNRTRTKLLDLFPSSTWTDDEIPISYDAITAATDTGTPQLYKKMSELFVDIANEGNNTVYFDLFFDKLSGGTKPATATFPIEWDDAPITFGVLSGHPVGDAPLGMASILNTTGLREKEERFRNRAQFGRVELRIRGNTTRRVSLRRMVLEYQKLTKKIKSILLSS